MSASPRSPAIFFGHGNPANALADNVYTRGWRQVCAAFPKPRAVLRVSAHWYVPHTAVTAMQSPRTIHDSVAFRARCSRFKYPAPGGPEIAAEVRDLTRPGGASSTTRGVWITARGACCATAIPMPMCRSFN